MKSLPIYETFHTWQGEGIHMGRAAFFIRTYGCPVHCPWCDSAGTWHKDWVPETILRVAPDVLAESAKATGASITVITGGEPAIHDLTDLTTALNGHSIKVHLETSGAFYLRGKIDWITVSPKWDAEPKDENVAKADELKLIVEEPGSIERWWAVLAPNYNGCPVWLHPEWTQRENILVLNAINEAVKTFPQRYRAGYQLHKLYNVDNLDPNAKPLTPIGGRRDLGF